MTGTGSGRAFHEGGIMYGIPGVSSREENWLTAVIDDEMLRFLEWQEDGLLLIGESARSRKPRLNTPVRIATDAGYCGA